jgi:hypothetical protein
MRVPVRFKLALSTVLVLTLTSISAAPAFAVTPGAGWELTARTFPSNLVRGGGGTIEIAPLNVGAAPSKGPVTVTDTLPAGVTATDAGELKAFRGEPGEGLENGSALIGHSRWACTGNGPGLAGATVVTCTNTVAMPELAGGSGDPNWEGPNFDQLIGIAIEVNKGATEGTKDGSEGNHVAIAGGGAPTSASTTDPVTIGATPSGFRFVGFDGWASNADGTLDTQAGSHPYELTVSFDLATYFDEPGGGFWGPQGGAPKDIEVNVPPGLIGDPNAVPTCTRQELDANKCPETSQVGILTAVAVGGAPIHSRLYNMVPPAGVPAEIGYRPGEGIEGRVDFAVRTGSDYGLTGHSDNTPERDVIGSIFTIWGVPGDHSHDPWRTDRSGGCTKGEVENPQEPSNCKPVSVGERPYLTLPTACAGPQTFTIRADTWFSKSTEAKAVFATHDSNGNETGFTGCERLGFGSSITTEPDTFNADTPAGLTVEVKPPAGGLTDPNGVGTSDIQNTTVTLPDGLVINPGQAAGLQACQPSQDGLTTEAEKAESKEDNGPSSCPLQSKVGTVEIETPLLKDKLEGSVFVLQSNPPELKLLVAASGDGVSLKLVGTVHLNEQTGQLTTKFEGTPELPFTDFKLSFSGGAQAALDTPTQCGTYTTNADFNPWSSPFISDFVTTASFGIEAGPGGGSCPSSPLPFSPSMIAGSTTDQAGAFTNFSLLLQRGDGQQRIEKLQFKEPAGAAGMISQVPLCPEPQAAQGACSAASHIGHAVVTSGPGPYPLVLPQPGAPELPIFLTGPYKGAPFGLSIVTPVIAGPFNLGTIITRAKIEVDPLTAQITITTDPLPQIVDGVPTDLRSINSIIDRPGFLFNPTNCTPAEFTGTAWSTPPPGAAGPGATAAISSHFGVGSCRELAFKPQFKVSTSGKTSRKNGASLDVKLAYPKAPFGSQANIASVKVKLPKQLPSRLTTLQKACTDKVFNANPAACPAASRVGTAMTTTPILPVALNGPVYFVSHGAAKFPELIIILQGYGVTVDLHGETFISKAGITSTTFKTVPDVPVGSFELTLPEGKFSALAANGNLCKQKLLMPTRITAQNGAVINQSTKIAVSGCAKPKVKKPAKRKKK